MADQTIEVLNVMDLPVDVPMFMACLKKIGEQIVNTDHTATFLITERKSSGWLEYNICITKPSMDYPFVIGAIQRTPDAEIEFHS